VRISKKVKEKKMKKKRKGFTLVELLVVIAIIALLMGILLPALARVRALAYRVVCGTNLKGIGTAMLIYANDYDDELPRAGGRTSIWGSPIPNWTAIDRYDAFGVNRTNGEGGTASISSCFYLLVKYAEVTPKSFVCKSDSGTREFKLSDYPNAPIDETIDAWDFGDDPRQHCSYTYHLPFGLYALTTSSEPGLAVAADRNPWIGSPAADPKTPFTRFMPDEPPRFSGSTESAKFGNSGSHQDDGQQVMFMDSHVEFCKRAYCAIENDNIYTRFPGTGYPEVGEPPMPYTSLPGTRKDNLLVHDGEPGSGGGGAPPAR